MRHSAIILLLGILQSCALHGTLDTLELESPPPELGRPSYVRYTARTGSWIGGVTGAVVSIATFPVTYPVAQLADEPLGYSKQEFVFLPTMFLASTGHFILGAPVDLLDWLFRRAWIDEPPPVDYSYTPQPPPAPLVIPDRVPPAENQAGKRPEAKPGEGKGGS